MVIVHDKKYILVGGEYKTGKWPRITEPHYNKLKKEVWTVWQAIEDKHYYEDVTRSAVLYRMVDEELTAEQAFLS